MISEFLNRVSDKSAVVGVIGLGYVGLPLASAFARKGYHVIGLDIDPKKIDAINNGESYLKHIAASSFFPYVNSGIFKASTDFEMASKCDALLLCVPTPLTENREPDVSYIVNTSRLLAEHMKKGQLVALESTTYPGTTDELMREILEEGSGLKAGIDFFLAYSPEREDPGNPNFETSTIPKIVGGYTEDCLRAAETLYRAAVEVVVPVQSTKTAEMVKLFENIYRAVNIALVNELKLLCQRLNIDTWEVIEAAATKPFGFQPFYPGPGLGGHCIPIDPFYLTWKARQVDMNTRFIELAGEINTAMPYHIVDRVQNALNQRRKSLNGSSILILGVAYKPNIDDMRESPSLKIIDLLDRSGARVLYHDPYVKELLPTRKYSFDMKSTPLNIDILTATDCVLVVTDHKEVDYDLVAKHAELIVDTRHVVPNTYGNVEEA